MTSPYYNLKKKRRKCHKGNNVIELNKVFSKLAV